MYAAHHDQEDAYAINHGDHQARRDRPMEPGSLRLPCGKGAPLGLPPHRRVVLAHARVIRYCNRVGRESVGHLEPGRFLAVRVEGRLNVNPLNQGSAPAPAASLCPVQRQDESAEPRADHRGTPARRLSPHRVGPDLRRRGSLAFDVREVPSSFPIGHVASNVCTLDPLALADTVAKDALKGCTLIGDEAFSEEFPIGKLECLFDALRCPRLRVSEGR